MLNMSILLFMFTDLVPNPDTKYMVGWIYIGAIALLVLVNFVAIPASYSVLDCQRGIQALKD